LQQFFRWLTDEEDIPHPMAGSQPPAVPQKLVPLVGDDVLKKLLATCSSKKLTDIRDRAIITLFASSGARLAEVAGLRVSDLDLTNAAAIVTGKGSRMRIIRYSPEAAVALSKYVKIRSLIRGEATDALWVGQRGPLLGNGIYQMMERRAKRAQVKVYPHQFRHTFSHKWKLNGGQDSDLMTLNGWSSPSMVNRYGASAAAERAQARYDTVMGC
jgi:site-specific recombinase XerC